MEKKTRIEEMTKVELAKNIYLMLNEGWNLDNVSGYAKLLIDEYKNRRGLIRKFQYYKECDFMTLALTYGTLKNCDLIEILSNQMFDEFRNIEYKFNLEGTCIYTGTPEFKTIEWDTKIVDSKEIQVGKTISFKIDFIVFISEDYLPIIDDIFKL